jgi:hypothetical protein
MARRLNLSTHTNRRWGATASCAPVSRRRIAQCQERTANPRDFLSLSWPRSATEQPLIFSILSASFRTWSHTRSAFFLNRVIMRLSDEFAPIPFGSRKPRRAHKCQSASAAVIPGRTLGSSSVMLNGAKRQFLICALPTPGPAAERVTISVCVSGGSYDNARTTSAGSPFSPARTDSSFPHNMAYANTSKPRISV